MSDVCERREVFGKQIKKSPIEKKTPQDPNKKGNQHHIQEIKQQTNGLAQLPIAKSSRNLEN